MEENQREVTQTVPEERTPLTPALLRDCMREGEHYITPILPEEIECYVTGTTLYAESVHGGPYALLDILTGEVNYRGYDNLHDSIYGNYGGESRDNQERILGQISESIRHYVQQDTTGILSNHSHRMLISDSELTWRKDIKLPPLTSGTTGGEREVIIQVTYDIPTAYYILTTTYMLGSHEINTYEMVLPEQGISRGRVERYIKRTLKEEELHIQYAQHRLLHELYEDKKLNVLDRPLIPYETIWIGTNRPLCTLDVQNMSQRPDYELSLRTEQGAVVYYVRIGAVNYPFKSIDQLKGLLGL